MPNVGGARASKRRVLASIVHSQLLYAAPVWHKVTNNCKLMQRLRRIQRIMSIRVCSTYKKGSGEVIGVIAEIALIDLLIQERYDRYHGMDKNLGRTKLLQQWQGKWNNGIYGRWTNRLIPDIQLWLNRQYGEVDYFMSQALSGDGFFRKYLYDRPS
ncbi:uncharacterized protein LOC115880079 [Sitophilus oryzae]|uniref:Uncharacterized protein LOC115880079 n=1 Tax=Sitophilus oryzae TaxID=7048 RepID=A0A6J2XQE4_SITOR|nr:uncharacterized protein LOC115880079 [Sitophilus oryzae]